jgi:hypothetical protein
MLLPLGGVAGSAAAGCCDTPPPVASSSASSSPGNSELSGATDANPQCRDNKRGRCVRNSQPKRPNLGGQGWVGGRGGLDSLPRPTPS